MASWTRRSGSFSTWGASVLRYPTAAATSSSPRRAFDHLDLTPPELLQSTLHRILQPLAFEVVVHLMGRRLTNIQNRFPRLMVWLVLVTHHAPPASSRRRRRRRRVREAAAPATGSSS